MRNHVCPLTFSLLLFLSMSPSAQAVDEGQSQPRLNTASTNTPSTTVNLIPLTNGAGNIKGLSCTFGYLPTSSVVHFYVDGGAAQTFSFFPYPLLTDAGGNFYTGFIPMNVRFDTSIRVQMQRNLGNNGLSFECAISWGLD